MAVTNNLKPRKFRVTMILSNCLRCGHEWYAKGKPLRCAGCKTPYWDRPKAAAS